MANTRRLLSITRACMEFREAHPIALDPDGDRFGYLFLADDDERELREYGEPDHIESFQNGWTYLGLQVFASEKLTPGKLVLSTDRYAMRKPPYAPPPGGRAH